MPEVDQGDRDEAAACDQLVAEHLDLAYGKIRPGQPGKGAAEGKRLVSCTVDVDSHAVGGSRMRSHRPHLQSPAGLEEDVPGHGHEEERKVDAR